MDYHEAATFLFGLGRHGISPGTESTADLLASLDDPQDDLACVQVAGSNGKGSTARMLERSLREAGLSVGLYTQPHFDDLRERVRVDGRKMTRRAVCEFTGRVHDHVMDRAADGDSPTFFETVTAMSLWEFARQEVDVAVLEVGIGGRFDATSVVDPVASAVTTVTLEHVGILGDTVEEIAHDKAHVAPADRPIVTATDGAALDTIRAVAGDVVTVGGADCDVHADYGGRVNHTEAAVTLDGPDWHVETHLPTLGKHQATNAGVAAALARQVGDAVGTPVTEAHLARGIRNAHWPARFEVMSESPLVVLDGAHNPGACEALADTIAEFDYDELHVVFGAMHDKDHVGMADALPTPAHVVTCQPDLDRAADADVLARVFERAGAGEVTAARSVADAVSRARDAAGPDDFVVVTGSLFTVGEARRLWTRIEVPKDVDSLDDARAVLEGANVSDAGIRHMRGKAVHRVVRTQVQRRQAGYLKEEMLALDGECAVSAARQGGELVDVVLMGTLSQYRRLAQNLDDQPWGLRHFGEEIRGAVGIGVEPDRRGYPWEDGTAVMGILNVTPDSFHDGGRYEAEAEAVTRAEAMVAEGAAIVDVGGESTRPGAEPVSVEEEKARVVPVVEALADLDVLVSVDTRKAAVARAALDAGADVLNDVSGLEDPEMRFVAAEYDVPIVVMHSIETPVDPDANVEYDDVVEDVVHELREKVLLAEKAGLDRSQILVDPGLGFGKTAAESFELLGRVDEFAALGCPILVGHSHKSMFAHVGGEAGDALEPTVAGTALAVSRGADVVRVHDVAENVAAVRVAEATAPIHTDED